MVAIMTSCFKDIIKVALVYPCDPSSPLIGGIESFIRGVIVNAPENIQYYVVGATTDPDLRPVGLWCDCQIDEVTYKFFPLYTVKNRGKRNFIPATIKYELSALLRMPDLSFADVIESHRIEHLVLRATATNTQFNLFLHQNMAILNNPKADILWKFAPRLYRFLEKKLFCHKGNVFCVREDAVKEYKHIYPHYALKFHFQPTWMDENLFYPVSNQVIERLRNKLCTDFQLDKSKRIAVAVARIDSQKDPILMTDAIASLRDEGITVQVLWIGDGVLKEKVTKRIHELKITSQFKLVGLQDKNFIADVIRGSDFFLMSSAYEGMPISVLEALACGCPVVSTSVGEIPRLIKHGSNGYLAEVGSIKSLTYAITCMINEQHSNHTRKSCLAVAKEYLASNVLKQVYNSYQN